MTSNLGPFFALDAPKKRRRSKPGLDGKKSKKKKEIINCSRNVREIKENNPIYKI